MAWPIFGHDYIASTNPLQYPFLSQGLLLTLFHISGTHVTPFQCCTMARSFLAYEEPSSKYLILILSAHDR